MLKAQGGKGETGKRRRGDTGIQRDGEGKDVPWDSRNGWISQEGRLSKGFVDRHAQAVRQAVRLAGHADDR
jgi:hypothetical protein